MTILTDVPNLYLLTECDMGCKFCYASKNLGHLTLSQAQYILTSLNSLGLSRINITGGEALLHPDALKIVNFARDLDLKVTLFTSGSLYNEERVREFSPLLDWLALSLDGDRPVNRKSGRTARHFDAALNAAELSKRLAPEVKLRIATVATQINVSKLEPLAKILADSRYTPTIWRIKQMVPTRRAKIFEDDLGVNDDLFFSEMNKISELYGNKIPIQVHGSSSKIADTMCIHPDGSCTATVMDNGSFEILTLGNVLTDPSAAIDRWNEVKNSENTALYQRLWDNPKAVETDQYIFGA